MLGLSAPSRHVSFTLLLAVLCLALAAPSNGPDAASGQTSDAASRGWRLVEGRHWQFASGRPEDSDVTDASEGTRGVCPAGMVEVRGEMKIETAPGVIEELQNLACTDWMDSDGVDRCARFDASKWYALSSRLPTWTMRFCIDRFEYPNRKGDYPIVSVTWREATVLCGRHDERLCTEDEWTFACEGAGAQPHASGYLRDREACVIDRPWRPFHAEGFLQRGSAEELAEIEALWQGEAAGSHPKCRSPFGVYDMTGNVDEWTRSVQEEGYPSILKGGYWGPVRTRCRPSTRAHDPDFHFYQQGFRCCSDASPS